MNINHSIKVFVKDTSDLWRHEAKYIGKHWKGLVLVSGIVVASEVATGIAAQKRWERNMNRIG